MIARINVVLMLAGCDRAFGLYRPPPPDASCVMPLYAHDSFDTDPPCAGWGIVDSASAHVSVSGGSLVIDPKPDIASTRGGCHSSVAAPFTSESGVFAEVSTTVGLGEYKLMHVDGQGITMRERFTWRPGALVFSQLASVAGPETILGMTPFDPIMTRWVRMRPLVDGTGIVAETSEDAHVWHEFAADPTPAPQMVTVELIAGSSVAQSNPLSVRFDGLNTCPGE